MKSGLFYHGIDHSAHLRVPHGLPYRYYPGSGGLPQHFSVNQRSMPAEVVCSVPESPSPAFCMFFIYLPGFYILESMMIGRFRHLVDHD